MLTIGPQEVWTNVFFFSFLDDCDGVPVFLFTLFRKGESNSNNIGISVRADEVGSSLSYSHARPCMVALGLE